MKNKKILLIGILSAISAWSIAQSDSLQKKVTPPDIIDNGNNNNLINHSMQDSISNPGKKNRQEPDSNKGNTPILPYKNKKDSLL